MNKPVIPEELITHYIVKDYQRMFQSHDNLLETIKSLREKILEQEKEISSLKSVPSPMKVKNYRELIHALENKNREFKETIFKQNYEIAELKDRINILTKLIHNYERKNH